MRAPSHPFAFLVIPLLIAISLQPLPPKFSANAQSAGSTSSSYAADADWVQDSGTTSITAYNHIIQFVPQLYSKFVPETHAQCVARLTPRGKPLIDITRECCIANLTYIGTSDILASEQCCRLIREIPAVRDPYFNKRLYLRI
jgi:hypothetical protein